MASHRIEPDGSGLLDVGDGQEIFWEEAGTPSGTPAVVLHGGPGSGCTRALGRLFDPDAYRVVLFDQRGAGRSRPRVEAFTDLWANTTGHLVGPRASPRPPRGREVAGLRSAG